MPRHISIPQHHFAIWVATAVALGACGCQEPNRPRLNAAPQGDAAAHPQLAQYCAYHDDQGMLADMSIADIHFVPHTAELSGTGLARLERHAELLAATGGRIRYDTASRDQPLVEARLVSFPVDEFRGALQIRAEDGPARWGRRETDVLEEALDCAPTLEPDMVTQWQSPRSERDALDRETL